jgi:hypothetical protein
MMEVISHGMVPLHRYDDSFRHRRHCGCPRRAPAISTLACRDRARRIKATTSASRRPCKSDGLAEKTLRALAITPQNALNLVDEKVAYCLD